MYNKTIIRFGDSTPLPPPPFPQASSIEVYISVQGLSQILRRYRFLKDSGGRVSYNVLGLYLDYGSKVTLDSYEGLGEAVLNVKGQISSEWIFG